MKILSDAQLAELLDQDSFHKRGEAADALGVPCYVVGGYVRDLFLERTSNDIDVVVVGSGIQVADALRKSLGKKARISVFRNFGTAQVKFRGYEIEFVGARKESYSHDSRKPIVENGTLEDDQNRRDFTINAMAACLNAENFGKLICDVCDLPPSCAFSSKTRRSTHSHVMPNASRLLAESVSPTN